MTRKERIAFRGRKEWKDFRDVMMEKADYTCQLCGCKYFGKRRKKINIHHLDEENYDNLNENMFAILCHDCHQKYHNLEKKFRNNSFNLTQKILWRNLFSSVGLLNNDLLNIINKSIRDDKSKLLIPFLVTAGTYLICTKIGKFYKSDYNTIGIKERFDKNKLVKYNNRFYIKGETNVLSKKI